MPRESYVHGSSGPPLIGKTIGALLDEVSVTDGSREALVVAHQNIRWTYSELMLRSDAFASGLLALGLEPGDRVGIWAPNCAEWAIAQFATAKAGLILVNINPAYRLSELEHVLRAVGCHALISAARFKTSDYIAMIRELVPELGNGNGGRVRVCRNCGTSSRSAPAVMPAACPLTACSSRGNNSEASSSTP
jgi:fatty-acyl-CoA synthase